MNNIWKPHPIQEFALKTVAFEILFGGARGGGKSDTGMAWMLKPKDHPKYRGLVIRRNSIDLTDWIDRAALMYGISPKGNPPIFEFPSGAKIFTGHLKDDNAYTKYQGHEYQRMLIEELTHILSEELYLKLISSCRSTIDIDPRIFCTTNPREIGHRWVKKRFVDPSEPRKKFVDELTGRTRIYIPARIEDNPTLMNNDPHYIDFLNGLPEDLKRAWRDGDWNVGTVKGAYYFEDIQEAQSNGRITRLPLNKYTPVDTWWDLGLNDSQTCGFFQRDGKMINVVDCFSHSDKGWDFYTQKLREKGYNYGIHFVPHDAKKRSPDTLKTFKEHLKLSGFNNVVVVPRIRKLDENTINQVRAYFNRLQFDAEKCEELLDALSNYRKDFDDKLNVAKNTPLHDWTSHYADMIRILPFYCEFHKDEKPKQQFSSAQNIQDRIMKLYS